MDISTGDTFEREYIIATGKADADMVGDAQWSEPVEVSKKVPKKLRTHRRRRR